MLEKQKGDFGKNEIILAFFVCCICCSILFFCSFIAPSNTLQSRFLYFYIQYTLFSENIKQKFLFFSIFFTFSFPILPIYSNPTIHKRGRQKPKEVLCRVIISRWHLDVVLLCFSVLYVRYKEIRNAKRERARNRIPFHFWRPLQKNITQHLLRKIFFSTASAKSVYQSAALAHFPIQTSSLNHRYVDKIPKIPYLPPEIP